MEDIKQYTLITNYVMFVKLLWLLRYIKDTYLVCKTDRFWNAARVIDKISGIW